MILNEVIPSVDDDHFLEEVEKAELPVLVLFRSVWSAPSRSTLFALEEVAGELAGKLKVVQLDMMDNWVAADRYHVRSTPTLLFLERGRELARHEGMANVEKIRQLAGSVLRLVAGRAPRPRRILLALDADPMLEALLSVLHRRVRVDEDDEVVLLHALPVFPWIRPAAKEAGWAAVVRAAHQNAENLLSNSARQLNEWGIRARTRRVEGHPAEEILRAAGQLESDLIVIGGLAPKERDPMLLGSVAEKVKAHAQTDVLIVREGAPHDSRRFRVLAAVDGSRESLAALEAFAGKFQADRADILLVHVQELEPAFAEAFSDPFRRRAELALSSALRILKSHGLDAATEICRGKPAVEILQAAARYGAELIVMGSRGLSGWGGLWLGSVTQRVVRQTDASVLIARERGQ